MASSTPKATHVNTGRFFKGGSAALFFLLLLIFTAARLWQLATYPLALDEIFSLTMAQRGWTDVLGYTAWDVVHPPLFYLLLKFWIGIGGESLFWLRLFPSLTAIASIVPLYLLGRELKLRSVEMKTALLFIAVNGYLIYYAKDLRMYSLLLFFTLCSLWLFVRWINSEQSRKRDLAYLIVGNLLLIFTHYFGLLVVGVELIYVLVWKRDRLLQFCLASALLVLCFSPWVYLVVVAAVERGGIGRNLAWLTRPKLFDLIWYYATLHGTVSVPRSTTLGLVLFGSPLALFAWRSIRGEETVGPMLSWGLALFAFVPVFITFCASWLLPYSVWEERSLIIASVPYLILIAVAVSRLRVKWIRILSLGLVIIWSVASSVAVLRSEKKIRWDVLARTMSHSEQTQTDKIKVFTFEPFVDTPLRYALDLQGERRFDVIRVHDPAELHGEHFWVAYRDTTWRDPSLPQIALKSNGCEVAPETQSGTIDQKVILFSVECR